MLRIIRYLCLCLPFFTWAQGSIEGIEPGEVLNGNYRIKYTHLGLFYDGLLKMNKDGFTGVYRTHYRLPGRSCVVEQRVELQDNGESQRIACYDPVYVKGYGSYSPDNFFIIYDTDGYGYMVNHDVVGNVVGRVHFSVAEGEILEDLLKLLVWQE